MFVFVRDLSTGIILYSHPHNKNLKNPSHDKFAAMVAKQYNCTWRPDPEGNILVEFRAVNVIDWLILDGRRYTFSPHFLRGTA